MRARRCLRVGSATSMSEPLLMVSTASQWLGPARMARALAKADFEVSLLAPADSLAAKSRYVAKRRMLAGNAIPMEWLQSLIAAVDDTCARLLVPCDEMAIRLLFALVLEPPPDLPSATRLRLEALIRTSLGDPAFYQISIDKTCCRLRPKRWGSACRRTRWPTASTRRSPAPRSLGYPLVLKRRFGFAGEGVAIVTDADDLVRQGQSLLSPDQLDLGQRHPRQLLVQSFIRGAYHSQALAPWQGKPLARFAWERQVATLPCKGQTSVLRFVRSAESAAYAETLCNAFGISGFCNVQFVLDENGRAHLLEINRRIVTHMHMGERVGADLAAAMARQLRGLPPAPRTEPPWNQAQRRHLPARMAARSAQPVAARIPVRRAVGRSRADQGHAGDAALKRADGHRRGRGSIAPSSTARRCASPATSWASSSCAAIAADELAAMITETEAYKGPRDRAAHAFGGRRTARVEPLYARRRHRLCLPGVRDALAAQFQHGRRRNPGGRADPRRSCRPMTQSEHWYRGRAASLPIFAIDRRLDHVDVTQSRSCGSRTAASAFRRGAS